MRMSEEAFQALNKVIDEWNQQQPFLLVTPHGVRNIFVRPHLDECWQRFIAIDTDFNVDDGPFGFGPTEKDALTDLVRNPYYQQLISRGKSSCRTDT